MAEQHLLKYVVPSILASNTGTNTHMLETTLVPTHAGGNTGTNTRMLETPHPCLTWSHCRDTHSTPSQQDLNLTSMQFVSNPTSIHVSARLP